MFWLPVGDQSYVRITAEDVGYTVADAVKFTLIDTGENPCW